MYIEGFKCKLFQQQLCQFYFSRPTPFDGTIYSFFNSYLQMISFSFFFNIHNMKRNLFLCFRLEVKFILNKKKLPKLTNLIS